MKYTMLLLFSVFCGLSCSETNSGTEVRNQSDSKRESCKAKSDCGNNSDICFNEICLDSGAISSCQSGADCLTDQSCVMDAVERCDSCTAPMCAPTWLCYGDTKCQSGTGDNSILDSGPDFDNTTEPDVGGDF